MLALDPMLRLSLLETTTDDISIHDLSGLLSEILLSSFLIFLDALAITTSTTPIVGTASCQKKASQIDHPNK
jgi:hypothetical protein